MAYYAVDLFCGAGGFSEGAIQAGFHIIYSSDINADVEKTYVNRHNQLGLIQGYNTYFQREDIRNLTGKDIRNAIDSLTYFKENNIDISDIDAVFGGPPCQGFSRAGRRNPNDPRNMLFKEYVRVIDELKPKYVVMENVTGFIDMKFYGFESVNGEIYEDGTVAPFILKNEFERIGYSTLGPEILNASNYGVPQRRNRIIFMAYRKDCSAPQFPAPLNDSDNYVTLGDALGDLCDKDNNVLSEFQIHSRNGRTPSFITGEPIKAETIYNNELSSHMPIIKERFSLYAEGETTDALRNRIAHGGIDISKKPTLISYCAQALEKTEEEIVKLYANKGVSEEMIDILLTKKGIRTRLQKDMPSATVMTIADDYISPYEARTFSVRELARLQSFDDSFEFLGKRTTGGPRRKVEVPQYSQVGNAVPPLLAKAIANEIIKALKADK